MSFLIRAHLRPIPMGDEEPNPISSPQNAPSSNRQLLLDSQRPRLRKNTMMPPVLYQRQFLLPS